MQCIVPLEAGKKSQTLLHWLSHKLARQCSPKGVEPQTDSSNSRSSMDSNGFVICFVEMKTDAAFGHGARLRLWATFTTIATRQLARLCACSVGAASARARRDTAFFALRQVIGGLAWLLGFGFAPSGSCRG